jgi:hypothetical protein
MGDRVVGVVPIADATSGGLHLSGGLSEATSSMVVHLAGRSELPANTAFVPIVASDGVACAARNTAYVLSGGSTPATALADLVRARVSALTTDGCVSVAGDGTVLVRLGAAGRAIVTPRTFRSDLWVAPVTSDCHGKCRVPAGTPVFANADGGEFLVDEANKLDLNGHLTNATSGLLSQGADWLVTLELDSAAAQEFGTLTSRVVHAKEPGNQLAIIDHGVVLSAPVIQSAITDGTAQISGNLTQQDAAALAAQLSAPSVPADVTIETVPASSSS